MSLPLLNQSITLPDGRKLAYADVGQAEGYPIIYFHGFPGSRVEAKFSHATVAEAGVRVIAVDRPGFGQSCFHAQRSINDWPKDVAALADALGLDKFSILGVSSGGVYALACAQQIPDRLLSVGIAATPAPVEAAAIRREMAFASRLGFQLANKANLAGKLVLGQVLGALIKHQTRLFIKLIGIGAPASDRKALKVPHFYDAVLASLREAYRGGHTGPFYDLHLVSREWGFSLADIQLPIHLWHGSADSVVPLVMGHYLAEQLENCETYIREGEGHFSITVNYMDQCVRTLKQIGQQPPAPTRVE